MVISYCSFLRSNLIRHIFTKLYIQMKHQFSISKLIPAAFENFSKSNHSAQPEFRNFLRFEKLSFKILLSYIYQENVKNVCGIKLKLTGPAPRSHWSDRRKFIFFGPRHTPNPCTLKGGGGFFRI